MHVCSQNPSNQNTYLSFIVVSYLGLSTMSVYPQNLNTTTPMTFQPPEKLTDKEQANKYPSQKRCAIQCERRTTQGFGGRRTPITSITFSEKEQDNDNQVEL